MFLTPNCEWGGEGSLGCGIGYGYLHRIPEKDVESQPVDPEIGVAVDLPDGSKGVEPNVAPPTSSGEGFAEVRSPDINGVTLKFLSPSRPPSQFLVSPALLGSQPRPLKQALPRVQGQV